MAQNVIQIDNLGRMSFDDLISLYRQGYRLEERRENNIVGMSSINAENRQIRSLVPCLNMATVGTTLTLSVNASSGTPPYTYHWTITKPDGTIDTSLTASSNTYTVNALGNYKVSVYTTDSCADGTGAKSSVPDTCTINVTTVTNKCAGVICTTQCYGVDLYNQICDSNTGGCIKGTLNQANVTQCGGGSDGKPVICDTEKYYSIGGQCVDKKYVLYGGAAVGVLVVLMMMK